jgi:hypothetical protein
MIHLSPSPPIRIALETRNRLAPPLRRLRLANVVARCGFRLAHGRGYILHTRVAKRAKCSLSVCKGAGCISRSGTACGAFERSARNQRSFRGRRSAAGASSEAASPSTGPSFLVNIYATPPTSTSKIPLFPHPPLSSSDNFLLRLRLAVSLPLHVPCELHIHRRRCPW